MRSQQALIAKCVLLTLILCVSAGAVESSEFVDTRAAAAPTTTLSYSFSTVFKNSGIAPAIAGKLTGKFKRVGTVNNQQLAISLTNLTPSTTFQIVALLGSDTGATPVASFTSDAKGKFKLTYLKKDGSVIHGTLLPDVLSPLINVRELDIAGSAGVLLRGGIAHPDTFSYQFKGPLTNTGAVPAATASLQLRGTQKTTQFGLTATGLAPTTGFLVAINVLVTQMVTSDKKGKLAVKKMPPGAPGALDIHIVSLLNLSGIGILSVKGLGIPPDNTAPSVRSTTPADMAVNVPTNAKVSAAFNKAVNPSTISASNFTVTGPGTTPVAGAITYNTTTNSTIFTPASTLSPGVLFTATLAAGIQDFSGNVSASGVTWSFTTGATTDTTAPFVTSTNPANGATGVPVNRPISATFNKTMDASTINSMTFTIQQGSATIDGSITYSGTTATFTPSSNLATGVTFTGTLTTIVADLAGNELASTFTWSFTTGAAAAAGPAPIALGSSGSFGVLAGSTVTSVGPTQINGDLGVSPGSGVTGFPPGIVTGSIHAGDDVAAKAKSDLLAAYNDGAARLGAAVLPGNLGGLTFTPGLYKNSSSTMISGTGANGILTLDAQGDANAVFIFQMGSTLTTDPGTQIVLSGGAKAANIYWQVGTSATLGTTSIFKGNILADQSITLTTGATLEGRALTRIGAVALDSNTITVPAP